MDHSLQKAAQRKAGIAARRALSAAARSAADAALCRRIAALHCFRNARTLLAYAASKRFTSHYLESLCQLTAKEISAIFISPTYVRDSSRPR